MILLVNLKLKLVIISFKALIFFSNDKDQYMINLIVVIKQIKLAKISFQDYKNRKLSKAANVSKQEFHQKSF